MFDPAQPSWTAGMLALLYAITRFIERRAKRDDPAGIKELRDGQIELRECQRRADERLDGIDQRINSLVRSNNHRKEELAEANYNIRRIVQRLDEASDSGR